jgi:predicted PurR-regulated permease PerM
MIRALPRAVIQTNDYREDSTTKTVLYFNGSSMPRLLQLAVYVVIVAWGIRTASHILSVVLLSLLLAYIYLPIARWLMHRFNLRKASAIGLTLALVVALYLSAAVGLIEAGLRMREQIPVYRTNLNELYRGIVVFLSAHGIQFASASLPSTLSGERMFELLETIAPTAIGVLSDRVFIGVLALIFAIEMAAVPGPRASPLARRLVLYGEDVQRFISLVARTGAISAGINLVLLLALGVDFAGLWCSLYFLLQFIPSVGFVIAMVPPSMVALLTSGWQRSVLVAAGMIVTQMISDYVIQPRFMKKGLHISLLQILLSLLLWGFLLGPAGAILAVPLTIACKKFIQNPLEGEMPVTAKPGWEGFVPGLSRNYSAGGADPRSARGS